ncbi:fructosamine kinase family protein [Lusitaniella coriacea LEGE 07157]|uniref:Fructosamine kinase family protein n=1 Tax=Lusitaniella coriacea LEGE 07157 TaxID=945747 RepID=A0A8J7DZZ1_9CYAN|nr:fructosamine kinase family protein [Lusitaniella coriacea]MBE9118851.1 fructosamine kinase family protein [Lusitaniella coriacea LEGE 07157]
MWNQIATQIAQTTGKPFEITDRRSVSGGCINQGYSITDGEQTYFVKTNEASQIEMFEAEALGLKQMHQTQTIRVPQPICCGVRDRASFIAMEWLEFGRGDSQSWEAMGRNLAALHKTVGSDRFGWDRNNTIGSTPQINTWTSDWSEFFAEHRIGYQLRLAKRRGGSFPDISKVVAAVRDILADWQPQPSLVHGDLWSGNAACTTDGEPVILDPATYWGDRETDIAMTELFGGFPAAFYRGYNQAWQLDGGYKERKTPYNLYHILNHFNLFGGGYGSQASRAIDSLLR